MLILLITIVSFVSTFVISFIFTYIVVAWSISSYLLYLNDHIRFLMLILHCLNVVTFFHEPIMNLAIHQWIKHQYFLLFLNGTNHIINFWYQWVQNFFYYNHILYFLSTCSHLTDDGHCSSEEDRNRLPKFHSMNFKL